MILEPVTDVIEAEGSRHLAIDQGDEMAPGRERSRLFLAAVLASQLRYKTRRDVLANGVENGESTSWLGSTWFLFHCGLPVADQPQRSQPTFSVSPMGWLCSKCVSNR